MNITAYTTTDMDIEWTDESWDTFFMKFAILVAEDLSTLHNNRNGAVVVLDRKVLAFGGTEWTECDGSCRQIEGEPAGEHSDGHALHPTIVALRTVTDRQVCGATLYITEIPCDICIDVMNDVGIARLVCLGRDINI